MRRNNMLQFFRVLFNVLETSIQTPIVFTVLGAMDMPSGASCFQQKKGKERKKENRFKMHLKSNSPEIFSLHSSFVSYLYSHFFTSLRSIVNSLQGG